MFNPSLVTSTILANQTFMQINSSPSRTRYSQADNDICKSRNKWEENIQMSTFDEVRHNESVIRSQNQNDFAEELRITLIERMKNGQEFTFAQVKTALGLEPEDGDDLKIVYIDEHGSLRARPFGKE